VLPGSRCPSRPKHLNEGEKKGRFAPFFSEGRLLAGRKPEDLERKNYGARKKLPVLSV